MPQIVLAFLGPFTATIDEEPVLDFPTDKVRALLAYLALEPDKAHARATLSALLWPDLPDQQAFGSLRSALYRLRRTLDRAAPGASQQVLTITRQTVQFNASAATVDVAEFGALLAASSTHAHEHLHHCSTCLSRLTQAVALYRGELLAGFGLADAPAYEEWLLLRREQIHRRAVLALKDVVDACEAQGDDVQTHDHAVRLLELDPYWEEAYRQIMRILARRGLPNQALAQYGKLRQLLRDELGVEPDVETTDLYEQIASGKWQAAGSRVSPEEVLLKGGQVAGDLQSPNLRRPQDNAHNPRQTSPSYLVTPPPPPVDQRFQQAQPGQDKHPFTASSAHDWGDAPVASAFYGRSRELAQVQQWLVGEGCRVVAILGMGGVGKTTLAAQTARTVAGRVELVIWRSLVNAPTLDELLPPILQVLAGHQLGDLPTGLDAQMGLLFVYLRERRVLLVLDNVESILQGEEAGAYRPGYEAYGQFLQRMVSVEHNSQLLLTSRERPWDTERLERDTPLVRSLRLSGLDDAAGHELLAERGVAGPALAKSALVERYSGNPMALKLVADTIQDLFGGDIDEFLTEETLVFNDIRAVLDQQFGRLPAIEQEILLWLAIEREPIGVRELQTNLVHPPSRRTFLEALRGLQKRSLIERHDEGFMLQNVVTEYLTDRLVDAVCGEIEREQPELLHRHALLKAQARDYVRQSQARLILDPIGARLVGKVGRGPLVEKFLRILAGLRRETPGVASYAAGNLLNLLLHLGVDVTGYDFSRLNVRQAYLRGASLPAVDFRAADLSQSAFTDSFGAIYAVAISSDGRLLAAGANDGEIRLWRLADGRPLGVFHGHTNGVRAIAFSPDARLLASASLDRRVCLWDVQSGRGIATLDGHGGGVRAVAFSPDGRFLVSGSGDQTVRIWNVGSGQMICTLARHTDWVKSVVFHPNGEMLASGGDDGLLCLWDVRAFTGQGGNSGGDAARERAILHTVQTCDLMFGPLVFSPDGSLLASGHEDGAVRLWEVDGDRVLRVLHGHTGWIQSLAFTPDGSMLISGGDDRTVRLWDVAGGRSLDTLRGHANVVWSVAVSPDGETLASGGEDDSIRLWDLRPSRRSQAFKTLRGHVTPIYTVTFSPDGATLVTGDGQGNIRLWPLEANGRPAAQPDRMLTGHAESVRAVVFSPDGRFLASASDDNTVQIWEADSGEGVGALHGHTQDVHCVAFAPGGTTLASAGRDSDIHLWDVSRPAQGQLLNVLRGHSVAVFGLAFSPDGTLLASSSSDQSIRLWNVATGRCIQVLDQYPQSFRSVVFAPGGDLLASASKDGRIRLWDMRPQQRGTLLDTLQGHIGIVRQVVFSPDGRCLASAGHDQTVRLWDVATGAQLHCLAGHTQFVISVAFRADGEILASASADGTVRLWDVRAGRCVQTLRIPGPYAGMNIAGVTGITDAQKAALKALGAVER